MTTKLDKTLKREIEIDRRPYVVTITPEGLKLTGKGKRKGQELKWADLVSGEAALAVALNASLQRVGADTGTDTSAVAADEARNGSDRSNAKRKSAARAETSRKATARRGTKKSRRR